MRATHLILRLKPLNSPTPPNLTDSVRLHDPNPTTYVSVGTQSIKTSLLNRISVNAWHLSCGLPVGGSRGFRIRSPWFMARFRMHSARCLVAASRQQGVATRTTETPQPVFHLSVPGSLKCFEAPHELKAGQDFPVLVTLATCDYKWTALSGPE